MTKQLTNQLNGYFDYAGATPLDADVLAKIMPFFSDNFYNPSAIYSQGQAVAMALRDARQRVASVMEVKPGEIVFTSGCSEANNLAIQGIMRSHPGKKVLYLATEHDSILKCAEVYTHEEIAVSADGLIDLDDLRRKIDDSVVLICVQLVNNEIGTIQPLREVSQIIKQTLDSRSSGLPLYLHTDAAQAANYISVKPHTYGVDMMSLNGGKIYGPKGSGCLYIGSGVRLSPLIYGGGQEGGLRSGTEAVPQILGFAHSLETAQQMAKDEARRLTNLRKRLIGNLLELDGSTLNGHRVNRIANNVHITIAGIDNERLAYDLDQAGFQVASGSACHALSGALSTTLKAIGLSDQVIRSSTRITLGRYTTENSVDQLAQNITNIVAKYIP